MGISFASVLARQWRPARYWGD